MQDTINLKPGAPTPSFADLQNAVTRLVPLIEGSADAAEAQSHPADEVAALSPSLPSARRAVGAGGGVGAGDRHIGFI